VFFINQEPDMKSIRQAFRTACLCLMQAIAPVAAGPGTGIDYAVVYRHSGKCQDVRGADGAAGAEVIQWPCHGGDNQKLRLVDEGGGHYSLAYRHSGLCTDVYGGGTVAGQKVIQWPCHGGDNQLFGLEDMGGGYYAFRYKHSGQCLDVYGAGTDDAANVIQWPCHGGANQQFSFVGSGLPDRRLADFLVFSINVQDFAYPERSAATVVRILDIHEQYGIPVDIYLTDTMLAIYEKGYPALMNRLLASPLAGLAYHIRPPKPYYENYDWAGLAGQGTEQRYASILDYETHVVDLVTGLPTVEAGGFARLRALAEGRPVIAAFSTDATMGDVPARVFADLGARFRIRHGTTTNLGERQDGLYVRPEHYDLLLFQSPGQDAGVLIDSAFDAAHAAAGARAPYFVGVKMHDNDFFADHSAWNETYIYHGRHPPWDLSAKSALLPQADQDAQWTLYTAAVAHAAARRERIGTLNSAGLDALLAAGGTTPRLYVSGTLHIENNPASWPDPEALKAFLQRALAAGRVGNQATGMRWSIGADLGYLTGDPRARQLFLDTQAMGVEWDIHAHSDADRVRVAETIAGYGGRHNDVVSGLQYGEIDALRAPRTSAGGYAWQAGSLYGITREASHAEGSEDFSFGLYRPQGSAGWQNHDPAANLVAVGGGSRDIVEAETLAGQLAAGGHWAPVISATVMVSPTQLKTVTGSRAGIAEIESWAARMGAREQVRWATLSETAAAWVAAGEVPSRVNSVASDP
jgi:hypothetical protein